MAYEGGYTSALDSASNRQTNDARRQALLQAMAYQAWEQQQMRAAQERRFQARQSLGNMLPELAQFMMPPASASPPPQPPAPGAPSVPMQAAPMGQLQMPGLGFATPPRPNAAPGAPPVPPPAAAGAPLPGGRPMPLGSPGGAPPAPGGAAGALTPWKALPAPPGPPQGGPQGLSMPPGEGAVMPRQMVSVSDMAKLLSSKGITGEKALDMLDEWKPYMDESNKLELDRMRTENQALKAATDAYARVLNAQSAAKRAGTAEDKLKTVDQPKAQAQIRKWGGATPGNPGVANPPAEADKPSPMEAYAWDYILYDKLPYRKGTGGGRDKNDAIVAEATRIARELGMSIGEMKAQTPQWKADMQSMAFQTKKVDAIEGQLRSFHNNLDTFDNLAKGLPPALGGERTAEFAKDLQKINFTGVKSFDEVKMKIQSEFDDPSVAAYLVSAMAAAMDYARIMQGPQSIASLTEGARKDAERLISAGYDDKARAGVLAALESDTEGQVKGVKDQLSAIKNRMVGRTQKPASAPKNYTSEDELRRANPPSGPVTINGRAAQWVQE